MSRRLRQFVIANVTVVALCAIAGARPYIDPFMGAIGCLPISIRVSGVPTSGESSMASTEQPPAAPNSSELGISGNMERYG